MSTTDLAHLLIALAVLLMAAHGVGTLFARIRQPRVIGEIVGGILLGPTLLARAAPGVHDWLFPAGGTTPGVLSAVYQLGLLLLMFCSGMEIRSLFSRDRARTVAAISVVGLVVPFVAGLLILVAFDLHTFHGPAATSTSFLLVFATAMAVTSIPVISRIMVDLGILDTRFGRIVLGVAVVEDVILYVVLAVALSSGGGAAGTTFGLSSLFGFDPGSVPELVTHTAATLVVLAGFLLAGPKLYGFVTRIRFNGLARSSPVAHHLLFMLVATVGCVLLGVQPFLGALLAGTAVGATRTERDDGLQAIRSFSFAFFVPLYFALVGAQLDLLHGFPIVFFVLYLAAACVAKSVGVYAGAKLAAEPRHAARNLAVAMNARGGPGIVLASLAFQAGVVDQRFYAVLVLVAVVTSLAAGSWLRRSVDRGQLDDVPGRSPAVSSQSG